MKIGVLTTSYPRSEDDPAGHFVRGFAEWLAGHVGAVEVVALDGPGGAAAMATGGLPSQLRGPLGVARATELTARLLAAARRRAPRWDAIVSHWLLPCGLLGHALAGPRRHLAIAHGSDVRLLRSLPGGVALARRIAARADLVYVADALCIDGAPGRVVAMPPGRVLPRRTEAERAEARATLGLPGDALVLLFIGRLVPEKGLDLLLDALPPGASLLVVGDGPERTRLQPTARAKGHHRPVTFAGPRFGAALRPYLAAADLLVVPSRQDGAPTVIEEAHAVGLPVLASAGVASRSASHRVEPTVEALGSALAGLVADRSRLPPVGPVPPSWAEVGPRLWDASHGTQEVEDLKIFYA